MRSGVLISIVSHVIFVALALLGTPKLFDEAATRPIEVELVRPEDAPPERPEEKPPEPEKPKEKDKSAEWNPLPDQSPPPQQAKTERPVEQKQQQAKAEPQQQPQTKPEQPHSQPAQPQPGPRTPQPQPQQPQARAEPSVFDPASIPMLLNLPNGLDSGFDSESMVAAKLTEDQKAALKAHLRKCWKLPGTVASPATRVVLRVSLRRDGKLASEPVLIEASASRDGPVVMQTAMRALKECQPYGFLPADKYSEWKVLDLAFTPRDMGGG